MNRVLKNGIQVCADGMILNFLTKSGLKSDGDVITIDLIGAAGPTINSLTQTGPTMITSTVNGSPSALDLTNIVKNAETLSHIVGMSMNAANILSLTFQGEDNQNQVKTVDLSPLAVDVNVLSAIFDPVTYNFTITETDGSTYSVSLADLIKVSVTNSQSITMSGDGTGTNPVKAVLKVSGQPGNVFQLLADGAYVAVTPVPTFNIGADEGNISQSGALNMSIKGMNNISGPTGTFTDIDTNDNITLRIQDEKLRFEMSGDFITEPSKEGTNCVYILNNGVSTVKLNAVEKYMELLLDPAQKGRVTELTFVNNSGNTVRITTGQTIFKDGETRYDIENNETVTLMPSFDGGGIAGNLIWWIKSHRRNVKPAIDEVVQGVVNPTAGSAAPAGSKYFYNTTTHTTSMANENGLWVAVTASVCPGPMTRAALVGLRNAGSLNINCAYVITDHIQGRLVSGTTITMRADSTTELSENVTVNSTYDNEGWRGIYDIDRALVMELQDNRGNIARGFNGLEVANFDWGNLNYTNILVDNATFIVNTGLARTLNDVKVLSGSTLNVTSMAGGSLTNLTIKNQSIVNLNSANATIANFEITGGSTVNAVSATGVNITALNMYTGSVLNLSGSTTATNISRLEMRLNATLTHVNVTTGSLSVATSSISRSAISHNNGALALTINDSNYYLNNTVVHSVGTMTHTRVNATSGIIQQTATAGSVMNLTDVQVGYGVNINNAAGTAMTLSRAEMYDSAAVTAQTLSGGALTVNDTVLRGQTSITKLSASTAGNLLVQSGCLLDSLAFINMSGTGNLTVTQATLTQSSRVNYSSGNRNYTLLRVTASEAGQINLSGTGAGITDNIQDTYAIRSGTVSMSATGTAANNIYYSGAEGLNGAINVIGTSLGQMLRRSYANDAPIQISNCTVAMTHDLMSANQGGGTISINNLAVVKNVLFARTETAGSINITGTVAGNITRVYARQGGVINVGGVCGSLNTAEVSQGTINFNGGASHAGIIKQMGGTLTTGNFNQSNIVHISSMGRTCTAANNNRSEYMGVVSSVPIV